MYHNLLSEFYHLDTGSWNSVSVCRSNMTQCVSPSHRHSRGAECCGCHYGTMFRPLQMQQRNLSWTLSVPFLSMVTRRSCLLCEWAQLITGSVSPSSVALWPTVRIWIWLSSCWKARPSFAAEQQPHKHSQGLVLAYTLLGCCCPQNRTSD